MNRRELIIEYINAVGENDERNRKIEQGLDLLCDSSGICLESITYRLSKFYDTLMAQMIGQSSFDWVMWYLYDSVGTDKTVIIDNIKYHIETPEQLCDICIGELE